MNVNDFREYFDQDDIQRVLIAARVRRAGWVPGGYTHRECTQLALYLAEEGHHAAATALSNTLNSREVRERLAPR